MRRTIGLGVIGFGWMGQAHSRSYLRLPTLFADRTYQPRLAICADNVAARREQATESFGFAAATEDWREVIDSDEVDVVVVTAPNMLHEELCVAASAAGKHVFCEKPVGGTPAQTVRIAAAARAAGIITGVGYNYRWAPMVLHTRQLLETDRLGQLTNYRGRFFSMYGSDPMGLLSWRFLEAEGGYGVSSDILSHAVDLATFLVGPIAKVVGTKETFIRQRPLPQPGAQGHYAVGRPGDPTGEVTNEDFAAALVVFANGVRGTFESSRSIVGPESQMAFELYGTKGAVSWNLEQLNELQVYLTDDEGRAPRGLHDGVRRRPLPLPRRLRAGRRQQHRLRGPGRHRGPRVPELDRGRRAAPPRLRGGPGLRELPGRLAALVRQRHVGGRGATVTTHRRGGTP